VLILNFNRNQTENDHLYWQKNNFLLLANFLKMYGFLRIRIQCLQKVVLHTYDQQEKFANNPYVYKETLNFILISNAGFIKYS
jgi:hypothetical protein